MAAALRTDLPTRWSQQHRYHMIDLSADRLTATYAGPGKADSDASAVRANRPIPPSAGCFYFEIEIVDRGREGYIGESPHKKNGKKKFSFHHVLFFFTFQQPKLLTTTRPPFQKKKMNFNKNITLWPSS